MWQNHKLPRGRGINLWDFEIQILGFKSEVEYLKFYSNKKQQNIKIYSFKKEERLKFSNMCKSCVFAEFIAPDEPSLY